MEYIEQELGHLQHNNKTRDEACGIQLGVLTAYSVDLRQQR